MDITRDDIVKEFEIEAEELLDGMEEALVAIESQPESEELLHKLFRGAHTLKGSAACLGFTALTDYGHALEDVLEILRRHELEAGRELISLLLKAIDLWRVLVPAALSGADEMPPEHVALLQQLATVADRKPAEEAPAAAASAVAPAPTMTAAPGRSRTLRVQIDHLDRIVNLTGEVAIARGRLDALLARPEYEHLEEVRDAHKESERLQLEVQEQVMRLRMVPLGPLYRQHIRTVRDLALGCGKDARVEITGEDVDVDMAVLESVRDPLVHLVRNAVDHGLESPEARRAAGKDPCGVVSLRARYLAGSVEIEVADDGGGLDRERILARAIERKLVAAGTVLTDAQIFELIFLPGFSTAEKLTEISGRGMGLDVVKRNLDALRGSVEVKSKLGAGTTVTLRVPLTLAIIQGFSVGVGSETYVVPLESVMECIEMPATAQVSSEGAGIVNLRGKPLPYLRLRSLFHLPNLKGVRESIVVIHHDQGEAGLVVDRLFGEGQVVLKPMPRGLDKVAGIFGSALLGDGRVALILDVAGLMRRLYATGVSQAMQEPAILESSSAGAT